jgi:segregation and condensation protein A
MNDSFKIKTESFEGPLDLLLSLIEKRKLFISDISLGKVTDDYLSHLRSLASFPLGDAAHFILIASTLLLIKSKSLLPQLSLTSEEEQSMDELENRLKIYQRIKELALHIKERFGRHILFAKTAAERQPVFSPSKDISIDNLRQSALNALAQMPKKEAALPQVEVKKIRSIEETISNLTSRIQHALKMSFKDFAGYGREEKVNVIVSFLAMLELVKQGIIDAEQHGLFSDIQMETQGVGTPRY